MKGTFFYFFKLDFYGSPETESEDSRLTTLSNFIFLLSKIINERLHKKTIKDIIKKKPAKNTDNF